MKKSARTFKKITIILILANIISLVWAQKIERDTICSGSSITLQATEKTGATYKWFANDEEITNQTESTLTVSPISNTTYRAEVTTAGNSNTVNLIPNGGFESGNITSETNALGHNLQYQYLNMQGIDKAIGVNQSAIVQNAQTGNPTWFVYLKPNSNSNRMFICDGGTDTNARIWQTRELRLEAGTKYEFSCWIANIHVNNENPSALRFVVENGSGTHTLLNFTAPTLNSEGWVQKTGTFTPTVSGWAHIWIQNNTTTNNGNDFALDDIYFGVERTTAAVTTQDNFTVNVDTPATVSIEDMDVCQNANFTLSATVSDDTNNVISWTKNTVPISGSTASITNMAPATVGTSDTYAISVKSGVCTAVTQSATVTALSCNSTQKDTICLGNDIVLNQAITKTYSGISWILPATGLSSTNTLTPTFTPTTAGTFAFTMTGTNTATSLMETINVTVVVETPATVSVDDVSKCINNPIALNASVSGGTNNSIAWTKNGNPLSEQGTEISDIAPANIGETDSYHITVTPTGACPAVGREATVTGTSCGVQAIINQQGREVCPGELHQLNATASTAHAWSTGESSSSVQVSSTSDTQYVVVSGPSIPNDVIDFLANNTDPVNGSEIEYLLGYQTEQYYIDIFDVTILDCSVKTIINRIVCQGESVSIDNEIFTTTGEHRHVFVGGSYLGGDSTVILNLRVIDLAILAYKTEICMGESLSLQSDISANTLWDATWSILPSDLILTSPTAKATGAQGSMAGEYQVELSASVTQSGSVFAITPTVCTATLAITVNPNPIITDIFTVGRTATILYDEMSGTAPFTFKLDNGINTGSELFNLAIGDHSVEIRNAEGCKSYSTFTIIPTPIIPDKFFSPNNDGINDRWNVVGIEFYPDADIQIFDRFGKQMIRYKGSDLGWDGFYNGNSMPTTDYWYVVTVAEINTTLSGHFTLKR